MYIMSLMRSSVTGRNNQMIELRNSDGTLNQALFLMDSNDYVAGLNDYDYIHDDEVEWYKSQIVCCSKYPSKLFDTAKELGSTKAMFCGHDHYNNMSLEYEGIRLTYGMSIDYLAMPGIDKDTDQRGGTLITCHKDSIYNDD